MFAFHVITLCGLVYLKLNLAYIMEVSKQSKHFRTLVHFPPTQNNRCLKDHFKMLNFPSFFIAFGMLQTIKKRQLIVLRFFPHREFMSQKIFLKKGGYLICLLGQHRNCYKFKIHSCPESLIISNLSVLV